MTRIVSVFACLAAFFACAPSAIAQATQSPTTNGTAQVSTLSDITRHLGTESASEIVTAIQDGLNSPDASIRALALAAVVSRAAAPAFSTDAKVLDEWKRDRGPLQSLRPALALALRDTSANVRLEAVGALASLDYDPAQPGSVTPATERELVARYYAEPDANVRAKIVAGFGAASGEASTAVKNVLTAAFDDGDPRVRRVAVPTVAKMDTKSAVALLAQRLNDPDAQTRRQTVLTLAKYGPDAAQHLAGMQRVIDEEADLRVKQQLTAVVSSLRQRLGIQ